MLPDGEMKTITRILTLTMLLTCAVPLLAAPKIPTRAGLQRIPPNDRRILYWGTWDEVRKTRPKPKPKKKVRPPSLDLLDDE